MLVQMCKYLRGMLQFFLFILLMFCLMIFECRLLQVGISNFGDPRVLEDNFVVLVHG